jgi:hypothetical protein
MSVHAMIAASLYISDLVAAQAAPVLTTGPSVYDTGPGRLGALVAALMGLLGSVVAGLLLRRTAGRLGADSRRGGAIAALALGLVGMAVGGVVVATAEGGLGTGNGLGGGIVALVLGLLGTVLGGLAWTRSGRVA